LKVVIIEPDDEVEGIGVVERVDVETGLAYLSVAWDSLHDVEEVRVSANRSAPASSSTVLRRPLIRLVGC